MKQFRLFAFILAIGAMFAVSAYAQKDPSGGTGTGAAGGPNHFGLSDSCWNVFLTMISSGDASELNADQSGIAALDTQINAINKQLRSLKGGLRDSTVRQQFKALIDQKHDLMKQEDSLRRDYGKIIHNNDSLLRMVRRDCGRHGKGTAGDPGSGLKVGDIIPNPATVGSEITIPITLTADAKVTIS